MDKIKQSNHKCNFCNSDFVSKRSHSKFCSHNCSVKSKYKERPLFYSNVCIHCNLQYNSRKKQSKFCSITCKNYYYKNFDINKICKFCNKSYTISYYKRKKSKFCSYSCSGKARWKNYTNIKKQIIIKKISVSHIKGYKNNKIKKRFGISSPNWKGGLTILNQSIRGLEKYNKWRKEIFIRDNFTCVLCDEKQFLNADHITPLCYLVSKNNIINVEQAEFCEELWDINNGRTLCIKCHKNTETYGAKSAKFITQGINDH